MTAFKMSHHAIERALEMNLDGEDIRNTYEDPEQIYWSVKYEAWNYLRGSLCLAVKEDTGGDVVVTVLWATPEAWAADAALAPLGPGRELRGMAKVLLARGVGP